MSTNYGPQGQQPSQNQQPFYPPQPQQPLYGYSPQPQQPLYGYPQQSPIMQPQWQGYPQQPTPQQPPRKRRGRLPLIIGIIVIILLFACIGAGALASKGASTSTAGSTVIGNVSNTPPTAVPTQASVYKVGDIVKVGDAWSVTILSVKASTGSAMYTPKAGMRYLVFSLAMKNLTSANHTISSIVQFTLRDDSGTKYSITIYPDAGSPIDGDVDGGQPAKGVIVYEVPATTNAFHLTFESNPFDLTSGRAVWNISA